MKNKLQLIRVKLMVTLLVITPILPAFGGGAIDFQFNNINAFNGNGTGLLFSDITGLNLLSAGVQDVADDGYFLQFVAYQGGSNYVLTTNQVGDNPTAISGVENGKFNFLANISSNVVAGAVGSPLGLVFYNNTSLANASAYGAITNLTITVPSPNYSIPPTDPTVFEVNFSDPSFLGARTAANGGFYTNLTVVPEPSTVFLVGVGLAGAWVLRRRKTS